ERHSKSIGKLKNIELRFHDGVPRRNNKKLLENIIKGADCVIIVQMVCSHLSMWDAKDVARKCNKKVYYSQAKGLASVLSLIEKENDQYSID
ncbi:MAG TPA: DUF2325 domain-containing protein, partial [Desulfitobacterium dehalogenans]|nr:DUF2325 domain-containing protein [Desulfitobacterium dehalogenans]